MNEGLDPRIYTADKLLLCRIGNFVHVLANRDLGDPTEFKNLLKHFAVLRSRSGKLMLIDTRENLEAERSEWLDLVLAGLETSFELLPPSQDELEMFLKLRNT